MNKNNNIRGSVLIFILLAVALLGALTVVLSRTSSNTEETGEQERMRVFVSQVLSYAANVKSAVDNLRARGCGENQISFWYDSNSDGIENGTDTYYNPNAPTDRSCHVFRQEGTGLTFIDYGSKIGSLSALRIGSQSLSRSIKGIGTDAGIDLYLAISGVGYQINKFCKQVNIIAGIPGGEDATGEFQPRATPTGGMATTLFTGTYLPNAATIYTQGNTGFANLIGKPFFCAGSSPIQTIFLYPIYKR